MREPTREEQIAIDAMKGAASVMVCSHVNPDGDAIGSVIALTLALKAAGLEVVATLADDTPAPSTYEFLEGFDLFVPNRELVPPQLFVALDSPSWERLGAAQPLSFRAGGTLTIDHHRDNHRFAAYSLVEPEAASTGSMIWHMLPGLGVEPTPAIASACYVALMTDTGRFSYGNTTSEALRDAADMIEAGAVATSLYQRVYENRTPAAMALLGRVLSRITLANQDRVAYSWMEERDLTETGATPEETENIIDVVRQTGGIVVAAFFKVEGDHVKVSLRSKTRRFDVSAIAKELSGGGHTAAAGCTVRGTLDDATGQILARLPGHFA
jgi:phosphoesterase RecJ-like protein